MRRRTLFFFLFLLFFFIGCPPVSANVPVPAWWTVVLKNNTGLPLDRLEHILSRAYQVVIDKAIISVTARSLAMESIKSLSTLDEIIRVYPDGKRIILTANGKILKSWTPPADNDTQNWSRLVLTSLIEVRPYSQKARTADDEEILNIFLNAALASVDKYSHYEGPDPATVKETAHPASLGIRFRRIGKYLEITDVLPETPAAQSVLAVGDRIIRLNGKAVTDLSRIETLNELQGEENTPVTLVVRKEGKIQTLTLSRAVLPSGDVTYFTDEKTGVLTVKIPAFTEKTTPSLLYTLNLPETKKATGIIVDLRGNMGGLLREAVLSADLFLPENTPLLTTKGRIPEAEQKYGASAKKAVPQQPLVILIDAKTASSAEFFAAVLQDTGRAVLVGTPTFGKARIQTAETLPNKGEVYLTWAKYYLPSGYSPDALGVYPNVCTSDAAPKSDKKDVSLEDVLPKNADEKSAADRLCPPQSRSNNAADDDVALKLIQSSALFDKAVGNFLLDSTAK